MARLSLPMSLLAAGCFAGALAGCTMHRGADGEKALWSTVDNSGDQKSKLKQPSKTHVAYAQLQEQMGKLGDARHSYEAALESDPKSVEATLGIARLDRLLRGSDEPPPTLGDFVTVPAPDATPREILTHVMQCHQRLAEIDCPMQPIFARIAEQMQKELETGAARV